MCNGEAVLLPVLLLLLPLLLRPAPLLVPVLVLVLL
jgi:hypothetical protein